MFQNQSFDEANYYFGRTFQIGGYDRVDQSVREEARCGSGREMMTKRNKRKFTESDSRVGTSVSDEASYYLGQRFEMGGVEFGSNDNDKKNVDENIFHQVCEALEENGRFDATKIEVDVTKGIVYLNGLVSSRLEKKEAEKCVELLPGVRDVMNELRFY